jgi:hypothetical protein
MAPCLKTHRHAINAEVAKLRPIYVYAMRLPLPIALQIMKKALVRKLQAHPPANRLDLTCQKAKQVGTHLPSLHCGLNVNHHIKPEKLKVHCVTEHCQMNKGNFLVSVLRYVNSDAGRSRLLLSLLDKVPSISANYTLRVAGWVPLRSYTQGGSKVLNYPLFITYIVKNGELVAVRQKGRQDANVTLVKDLKRLKARKASPRQARSIAGPFRSNSAPLCPITSMGC